MDLILSRTDNLAVGIFGLLTDEGGNLVAKTLEHAFLQTDNLTYLPKVVAGIYTCIRHAPNRLPYETFELQDVPDFMDKPVTGILIHVGNYNSDSDGCILVGRNIILQPVAMVTSSENTFNKIRDLQTGLSEFKLTIKDKT